MEGKRSTGVDLEDVEKGMEIMGKGLAYEENQPPAISPEDDADGDTKLEAHTSSSGGSIKEEEKQAPPPTLSRQVSQAEKFSRGRLFMIVLSLCIALFLAALDMSIITTALPTIARDFQASDAEYTWVGSAYLLSCASTVPVWGKLSDIWGRKPILLLCNVIFMAGSLFCALSTSITMLIWARVLQGAGGGGLIILVNICTSDLFSVRERGKYIGIVGIVWGIASALGPVFGGIFSEKLSWRWCFYINLPLDGCSVIMLIVFLSIDTPKTPFIAGVKAIDWVGVVTIVSGVVMFLLGLESGGISHPWASAYTIGLILGGLLTITFFFFNEARFAKYPIIPVHLFSSRTRVASLATGFCHGFCFISASYFLPLYFQTVLGATPLMAGVYTFPFSITFSIVSAASGFIIKRTGKYRPLIWFGVTAMTLGFGLFIDLPAYPSWSRVILFQIIAGIGVGPNFQSPLIAIQSTINPSDIATATATFGFVRQISTSLSVVLGGVVFQNQMSLKQPHLLHSLGPALAARVGDASSGSIAGFINTIPNPQRHVIDVAITDSLRTMWIFYVCVATAAIFCSAFIGTKTLSNERVHQEHGLEAQEKARLERLEEEKEKRDTKEQGRRDKRMTLKEEGGMSNGEAGSTPRSRG